MHVNTNCEHLRGTRFEGIDFCIGATYWGLWFVVKKSPLNSFSYFSFLGVYFGSACGIKIRSLFFILPWLLSLILLVCLQFCFVRITPPPLLVLYFPISWTICVCDIGEKRGTFFSAKQHIKGPFESHSEPIYVSKNIYSYCTCAGFNPNLLNLANSCKICRIVLQENRFLQWEHADKCNYWRERGTMVWPFLWNGTCRMENVNSTSMQSL